MDVFLTKSPHAINPNQEIKFTDEEKRMLQSRRMNNEKAYTVIDTITKVFHRKFAVDFTSYIYSHPDEFYTVTGYGLSRAWVNKCSIIRPESVFEQKISEFYVDILVSANIKLRYEKTGCEYLVSDKVISGEYRLRYRFNFCPCSLECHFVRVITDVRASLHHQYPFSLRVNKYLLPVFEKSNDYERCANSILRNHYPEQINDACPLDVVQLIENTGLGLGFGVFSDKQIIGEYFFNYGYSTLYHPENGTEEQQKIMPGTIIINKDVLGNSILLYSTLCHEYTHHKLCIPYLMLQKMHGNDYASYLCRKNDFRNDEISPEATIEIQANTLPAYLFIQEQPGKMYAKMLFEKYENKRDFVTLQNILSEFSKYFLVPHSWGKRRLIDFGYTEFNGFVQYSGRKRVPDYISTLKKNETYTIREEDGIKAYFESPEFKKIIDTGAFIFVEGHYCLNAPEYICIDQWGDRHLTVYARKHMSECCLVFDATYEKCPSVMNRGVLYRNGTIVKKKIKYRLRNGKKPETAEGKALEKQIKNEMFEYAKEHENFNDKTKRFMEERGLTVSRLAEETGLSERTIKNMRNDPDKKIQMKEVVAICIAMHLIPDISFPYINDSPTKFDNSYDMRLYQYALRMWYMLTVDIVNRKIIEANGTPLTNLVDGFDEEGNELVY